MLSSRRTVPFSARAVSPNPADQCWCPGRAQPFGHRFSLRPSAETLPKRREPQSAAQKPRRGLRARMAPLEFPNRRRICASGRSRAGSGSAPGTAPTGGHGPGKRGGGGRSSTAGEFVPCERRSAFPRGHHHPPSRRSAARSWCCCPVLVLPGAGTVQSWYGCLVLVLPSLGAAARSLYCCLVLMLLGPGAAAQSWFCPNLVLPNPGAARFWYFCLALVLLPSPSAAQFWFCPVLVLPGAGTVLSWCCCLVLVLPGSGVGWFWYCLVLAAARS